MENAVVTAVDAKVEAAQEPELIAGYRTMIEGPWPDGLLRAELLRGQNGAWRLQSTWRDMATLLALRASGARPAALVLLERLGLTHSHGAFTVQQSYAAPPPQG